MRFGNDLEACLKAIQIGFELSPRPSDTIYQGAVKTLEMVNSAAALAVCNNWPLQTSMPQWCKDAVLAQVDWSI